MVRSGVLACVIFFPRLVHVVNRGVRGGARAPPLLCRLRRGVTMGV